MKMQCKRLCCDRIKGKPSLRGKVFPAHGCKKFFALFRIERFFIRLIQQVRRFRCDTQRFGLHHIRNEIFVRSAVQPVIGELFVVKCKPISELMTAHDQSMLHRVFAGVNETLYSLIIFKEKRGIAVHSVQHPRHHGDGIAPKGARALAA